MLTQCKTFHLILLLGDFEEMRLTNFIVFLASFAAVNALVIRDVNNGRLEKGDINAKRDEENNLTDVFNGVYTECFLHLSYSCVQKKTLLYLNELNKLTEVSVIGDYVKFVKINSSVPEQMNLDEETKGVANTEELSILIDKAVDKFFDNYVIKFSALGRDIAVPNTVEEFVGRKRRKGGGGGHHGGDDGGKKKMMMMAMMCMKMKLMMMVPAMMGMMGMMSLKGMMFSMMSFMIAKMMLLMKLLEKKGGGGLSGADGGWLAGGGAGGAWMPAGADYGGAAAGGGYDANGQWQSRSIIDKNELEAIHNKPIISYVTPFVRLNNVDKKPVAEKDKSKRSRTKRGIVDVVQHAYAYWINRLLGSNINRRKLRQPNYKYVNGVKYVYYPMKVLQKFKQPKELQHVVKIVEDAKPAVIAEDFNKGEIVEGVIESRMNKKKFNKIKDDVNEVIEDNPWE